MDEKYQILDYNIFAQMDVDNNNFASVYESICSNKLIQRSSTVSIDLQFTGLKNDHNDKQRFDEFPFERYEKMRSVAMKYNIIQIGVCFFVKEEDKVEAYPFNFYIFPRSYKNVNPVISLQSSTAEFNSKNGMDWNRWINTGITYLQLSKVEEALYVGEKAPLQQLEKRLNADQNQEMGKIITQLKLFQSSQKDTIQLEVSSTFIRIIVDRHIQKEFKGMYLQPYSYDASLKQKLILSIRKVSLEDRKRIEQNSILDVLGFTKIFEKIWQYKVKMVFHNGLFDLLYIYQSFVADLPEDYFEFKKAIKKGFPYLYDTKYISNLDVFNQKLPAGTSLEDIQNAITKDEEFFPKTNVVLAKGYQAYQWDSQDNKPQRLHEAGYDAYLTGWVFYCLSQKIEYQKYQGKLKVIWSMFDINFSSQQDDWNEESKDVFYLILGLKKPKEPVLKLFDYKRNLMSALLDRIKVFPIKTSLSKDDYRYKQCRLDYLFLQCKSKTKKAEFIKVVNEIAVQFEDVSVLTLNSFLCERKIAIQRFANIIDTNRP